MSENEKRVHPRVKAELSLRISHESFGTRMVTSRDISDSGVHIEIGSAPLLLPGTRIDVQIQGLAGGPQDVEAEVVRIGDGGMGLRFARDLFEFE